MQQFGGDTGLYPLAIELSVSSKVYNNWERLEKMEEARSNCFVRHAFKEQRDLGISWNTNSETARSVLRQLDGHQIEHTPLQIREAMLDAIQLQADMEHRAIEQQET